MSITQASNFSAFAGLVVIILSYFGVIIPQEKIAFLIGAIWAVGSVAYNYWNRYKKGDLTLGGFRGYREPKVSSNSSEWPQSPNTME